jgi:SLT domain-containing protein
LSQRKRRNQKENFNNDDSNDDVITSSFEDVSIIAESVTFSSTFKLTKAKRAKIDITTATTIIIELTNAIKTTFQARTTIFIFTFINHKITSLNNRIFKLKDEMKIVKKNRELQNKTLAKILEAVQKK